MTVQQNNYLKAFISLIVLSLSIIALFYPIIATIIGYLILLTIIESKRINSSIIQ